MTGIEAFTAVTSLKCNNNQLASLDVSNNTALTLLFCNSNQLTSLDISNNTSLITLRAFLNSLTVIDVSTNTVLETLSVSHNNISSIDVTANTLIEALYVENNMLSNLNVANGNNANFSQFQAHNNTSLTCIQVDAGFTPPAGWQKDATASYSTNCVALSVNDFTLQNISIYPNPVRNTLNIQLEERLEKVEVYSIQGQKVLESTNSSVNTSRLSTGMYLLKILTQNGKVGVKRFIKQ